MDQNHVHEFIDDALTAFLLDEVLNKSKQGDQNFTVAETQTDLVPQSNHPNFVPFTLPSMGDDYLNRLVQPKPIQSLCTPISDNSIGRSRPRERARSDNSVASSSSVDSGYSSAPPSNRESLSLSFSRTRRSTNPNRDYILDLLTTERPDTSSVRTQKHPATFQCNHCSKRFTRAYNLRSHQRTHTDERPFVCSVCGKAFARQHDRKRHESLHSGEKSFACRGDLKDGSNWGCGRKFARIEALGRHFKSTAGRLCIRLVVDEEDSAKSASVIDNSEQSGLSPEFSIPHKSLDINAASGSDPNPPGDPMHSTGLFKLPAVILQQYPTIANVWDALPSHNADETYDGDISGNSSFVSGTMPDDSVCSPLPDEESSRVVAEQYGCTMDIVTCSQTDQRSSMIIVTEVPEIEAPDSSQESETQFITATSNAIDDRFMEEKNESNDVGGVQVEVKEQGIHSDTPSDESQEYPVAIHDVPPQVSSDLLDALEDLGELKGSQQKVELPNKPDGLVDVEAYNESTPIAPISGLAPDPSTLVPTYENCSTPSSILDEDMTDVDDEVSEPDTSFSSRASSTSIWPQSPQSADREALAAPILDESRRQIVDRLMVEVRLLLNGQTGIRSRADSTESSRSGSFQNDASGAPVGGSRNGLKRSRNSDGGSDTPGDGPGDDTPEKRPKTAVPSEEDKPRKLACPYYKRNSRAHQQCRSCAGPGWSTCHRIKEHIYRRHKLPVSCARCCTAFTNDKELSDHLRQPESCQIRRAEVVEGLDKVQEAQLRSRKKLSGTEEQRWKEMYMVLFPDDAEDMIPSPYYENDAELNGQSDEVAEYERYMARELPRLVRTQLEATVMGASGSLERQIQSQLVDIVRNCQRELFRSYAGSRQLQIPANDTNLGHLSDETVPVDMPPANGLGDINAVFPPPSLLDTSLLFSCEDLMQNSTGMCPPSELAAFSDSAYGSLNQNTAFADGFDAFGESNVGETPQFDGSTNSTSHIQSSEILGGELQQNDDFQLSSAEPWSSLTKYGWFPPG